MLSLAVVRMAVIDCVVATCCTVEVASLDSLEGWGRVRVFLFLGIGCWGRWWWCRCFRVFPMFV